MNDELKKVLTEMGLNEEQIAKLETAGALEASDLDDAELIVRSTGCGAFVARRIVKKFVPVVVVEHKETDIAANASPAGQPMNITVRTGNPEDMTVQELLTLIANGERVRSRMRATNSLICRGS